MSAPDLTGDEEVVIETTLNGKPLKRRVKARQHLADFLRHELELTGIVDGHGDDTAAKFNRAVV